MNARNLFALLPALAILALSPAVPASAQEEASSGVFTDVVEVRVVNLDVFVTDRQGQPVVGLTPTDFDLYVDGKPYPISNFYAEVGGLDPQPARSYYRDADSKFVSIEEVEESASKRAHILILFDHSRLGSSNRKRVVKALHETVDSIDDDALIAVVGIEQSLRFYTDFIYDREVIHQVLDDLAKVSRKTDISEIERRQVLGELARGQSGGLLARASAADPNYLIARIRAYAASEYQRALDSVRMIRQVVATMSGIPGRKGLLYVGEGIPTRPGEDMYVEYRNRFGSGDAPVNEIGLRHYDLNSDYKRAVGEFELFEPVARVAREANAAGVTLYAADPEGDHSADIRALTEQGATSEAISVIGENYRAPLEQVTKATGGKYINSPARMVEDFFQMMRDLDTYYAIGFVAPDDWDRRRSHDVRVEVRGEGLRVRHREDVRLPDANEREASATIAALMYQTVDNPLGISAATGDATTQTGTDDARALPVELEIPIERLELIPNGDKHSGEVSIFVATKDGKGNPGKVQRVPFHINIPDEHLARAREDSARYTLPIVLRRNDRQVAIGVRDNISGVFSAVRLDVAELSDF